jgi:hypothetical protein
LKNQNESIRRQWTYQKGKKERRNEKNSEADKFVFAYMRSVWETESHGESRMFTLFFCCFS